MSLQWLITVVFSLATSQLLYSLAEVYLFSHPLPFLTLNVDVYSSLDDGQIQCPSLFPELWCSGSCPLYLVRLSGRFSSVMCIRRSSSHGWKHDQKHCFSLCVVCPILLRYRTILFICCFSLFVAWIFWLAVVGITQTLGPSLLRTPQHFGRFCMAHLVRFFSQNYLTGSKLTMVYRVVLTFILLFVLI